MNLLKKHQRLEMLIKVIVVGLLPILCCLLYCLFRHISISDAYLPASEWNDELFYYKQVEGIINFGYPQGYFGFNESHALKMSFAAWSPILVFPWVLWGLLFGWNLLSPIACNIVLLTIALVIFVLLTKPDWKQILMLTAMFVTFTPFVRFMMSCMPEIIVFSLVIVFYGASYYYFEKEKLSVLIWLFIISALLTLMRPYLLLLMLMPSYLLIRRKKLLGAFLSLLPIGLTAFIYVLIKHFLGAEYFAPLFFTDWLTTFFTAGFLPGLRHFFGILFRMGRQFIGYMIQGTRTGLAAGAYFDGYICMMLILIVEAIVNIRELIKSKSAGKDENKADTCERDLVLSLHLSFSFVAMLFAIILMYKLTEGSKHMLTFVVMGIFAICLMKSKYYLKTIIMSVVFIYFYIFMAIDPYDYEVPVKREALEESYSYWQTTFDKELELVTDGQLPSFENVCIWMFSDDVDGEMVTEKWQYLYALPKGFGISCCMPPYINDNLQNLNSKYIAVVKNGNIDKECRELGYEIVGEDKDLVVFRRY